MKFTASTSTVLGSLFLLLTGPIKFINAECSDVHVVFARGSGEAAGFGICGEPLVSGITSNLAGMSVSSYAVGYLASMDQTSAGPGATDMTNHVVSVAQECPNTVFVLGGYSQGASVTDISIGIKTTLGSGKTIPDTLSSRIKAIVTFGNPLKMMGQTIESASSTYGSKAIEFCNTGDPVCGAGFNTMAHLTYPTDGSVTSAAKKAAALVKGNMQSELTETAPAEAENIAVCIRVRPMNERETRNRDVNVLATVPQMNVISLTDESGQPLGGKSNVFQYDQIFDASSDAHGIYDRVAKRIVRSTLGGINGTIFAYGQTSSGKTYTMQGDGVMPFEPEEATNKPGILQLAVEDIFKYIEKCSDRDFLLRVSFLEIYNEVVKDLLNPTEKGANLKLREDPRKGVYVECKEEIITNYENIVTLLQTGNQHRTVGQTAMNDRSSRSHSVFRIVIESKEKSDSRRLSEEDVNGAVLVASLNLVDLAGSESLRHTAAEGIRQREAGNINKSLLTLARVINSLASSGGGGQNAPFRDSKLTRLLQTSLGGNTRTLIICCVTPSDRYVEETKSTLQFAARAKDIQTSATVNEVLDDQTQLRRLKREVHDLKKLVNSEALNALKAENEALISEKNHNKTEMARLMGLILSSASVTKSTVGKKRKHHGKHKRETWGPGDFPANLKSLAPLSPNLYPRKRHFSSKENVDPQILLRVHEDIPENALHNSENPVFASVDSKFKPNQTNLGSKDDSKNVLDLFLSVFRSYNDGKVEDSVAVGEAIVNEKCASLNDIERASVFELLGQMRTLITADSQHKGVLEGKQREVEDLRAKLSEQNNQGCPVNCDGADSVSNEDKRIEEIMAELVSTQGRLTKEKDHYQELEEKMANIQQMAAEELGVLQLKLESIQIESNDARERFASEKRQLEVTLESLQAGLLQPDSEANVDLRDKNEKLEKMVQEMKASQTVLQLAVAERDEEITSLKSQSDANDHAILETPVTCLEEQKMLLREKISEDEVDDDEITPTAEALSVGTNKEELQGEPSVDQDQNGTVEKLAGELQNIMQELAQLQADNEKSAMEKEELQAVTDRINQELEVSQRQGYEMSEALMEKEHIAKVLQAQLNAKMTTISQMQTKRCSEIESLQQSIQDLAVEKESLVTRIQQLESVENTEVIDEEIEMSDSAGSVPEQQTEVEPQKLCSEVDQLSEKLLAAESELAQANERLEAVKDSSELSELRAAFDNLQADYDNLQKMNAGSLRERPVPEQQLEEPTSSEQQNAKLVDQTLQERYDALNADCERLAGDLEKLTHEREDCVDELRALENQLMEVSEDKMKLAVAVDEREMRLREMQQLVMSSTDEITALQVKLEETQSAKVALEDCKAGLEENVETAQAALQALQVDYNAVVEQLQCRTTALVSGSECTDSDVEQLQQRLEKETRQRERLELDVKSYEETLSVMRTDVKDGSHTIADLMDKLRTMQMSLDAAARSQELKDTEMVSLTDALTKAKEEEAELRFQRQQRMVAAEAKEMALEEKVSALQQQLTMSATGNSVIHDSTQTELQLIADKEKQEQLQHKVKTLDTQLAEAHQQLSVQDREWRKKQTMAETEFARMTTEQQQLREQVSILQSSIDANSVVSQQEATEQTAELLKVKRAYDELMEQKEVVQHELEIGNANWEEKEQDILRQMNSICEQFQEAQEELEEYKKSADAEIRRLHSLIEEANARIEEVKHATRTREEKLESQIGEQENWQNHVKNRQEELQAKCEELDDERRVLKEKYAALETERSDVEEQLQNEIHELSQECAFAKAQHADSEDKLKEMEAKLAMTENDVEQNRSELENLSDSLKSAQTETVQYHNKLVEAQVAKESMEKFIEKQKARIDKLEKVKMTTETLDLFRKLKNDRQDLQTKVQKLQQNLAEAGQALTQTQENHKQEEQRLVEHNEELQLFKQHIEELREALRVEKHQVVDIKAEMRNALHDEHEKAEHEIQEMQTLLKEKIDRAEQLEAAVASLEDNMTKLKQQKSENVSYLEKENLDLLVENRRLKKQLEPPSETGDELGITGTFDASAAEAAKALGGDSVSDVNEVELSVPESDGITTASTTAPPTRSNHAKAGGFLLSKTELDAIAGDSQEEQKDETRPECHQQ
ncbi:hypothetical protein JM16_003656 [Phytophthora kernoviae]|uniref:Kinesin motor domain-containing protein n=1 Tax=Phytophthora kernoviae TaxID=325452 RepID=A0A8T0M449_9STRA|nr:hypothetical protein JM16_003656 [Phytophthora kernoviae]